MLTHAEAPTVFISYSHKDEPWKEKLLVRLRALEQAGRIVLWHDRKIDAGEKWYPEIESAMAHAAVAVCLISENYLDSEFCAKEEIPYLLERRERDGMILIPILLRPCRWKAMKWIKETQMLPRDGKNVVKNFKGKEDAVFAELADRIFEIFNDPDYNPPATPAPRWPMPEKIAVDRLPVTGADIFGRQDELDEIDAAWKSGGTHVLSIVAWGGVGKTTLVNKWLERMRADNYRGARRVYAWSFYSQGTGERVTSADLFINSALEWFGDPEPTDGSPWDKGERLAALVRREKTLLLLDGLEPLQSSYEYERGKIKDPALSVLLAELARKNRGLCIITTREPLTDLAAASDTVVHKDLEQISDEAGRALLRAGGVQDADAELERATRDFGNHAFALQLLAVYLHDIPGHNVSHASEIPALDIPASAGKHPRRVMVAFERRFGEGAEVELLRMLGLFDRPADRASMDALLKGSSVRGLTLHIRNLSESDRLRVVEKLRRNRLVSHASQRHPNDDLDAHPLVREHFGQQLKGDFPTAWREGNGRLFKHLRDATEEYPDTLDEMAPLYAAVAHGCAAGRHGEALNDVYARRIMRMNWFFSSRRLGAFGANLAALSGFFDSPWQQLSSTLPKGIRAYILNEVGGALRALGRLEEAVQPVEASLEIDILDKLWGSAAQDANNLSELYLTIGNLSQALVYAQKSVEMADRSREDFHRMDKRTALAEVLYRQGRLSESEDLMREAEMIQKSWHPQLPLLYSVPGFRYCCLLLHRGNYGEVVARTVTTLGWYNKLSVGPLTVALDQLSFGCAHLFRYLYADINDLFLATNFIHGAVEGLRQAGLLNMLPLGLFARAELNRASGEFDLAHADLEEITAIATRGGMGLHQADCHLEYARLYLAQDEKEKARENLRITKEMIGRMGYHLRDEAVRKLEAELEEA